MAGQCRELEPKVAQVLIALASASPSVVSRDRLIERCWDGRIVGDDALNRCVVALRHLAKEFTPEPFAIETVPRVGYCLVEKGTRGRAPTGGVKWNFVAAALLALLVVGAFVMAWSRLGPGSTEPASIAVLPFRNLSQGDPYFAEGVGEEILGHLAREPQFRVAGSSSSSELGKNADIRQVARRLDVDYVLEGSVRRQGDRVRVSAHLVRASDGFRLWADSYDGKLDDIFAIQQQVGSAIAGALRRKLVRTPVLSGPLVTKGEAYNLYLTARALIRTNNRQMGPAAVALLRQAIRLDPGYAPAWASLAGAIGLQGALEDHESYIAAIRQARLYARQAVRLAPDLGEAHRALGATLSYGDVDGVAHLKRAATLDPNVAENLIGLGTALGASGEFESELSAYRRANDIDPLWYRTTGVTAQAMAEMGDRAGAEALARRSVPDKEANLDILLGRIAWIFADYSEAARRWAIVARSDSPRWGNTADRTVRDAKHAVGVATGPLVDIPAPMSTRDNWRKWMNGPPPPVAWQQRNRDVIAAEAYRKHNLVAAKLMLNAGRGRELVTTYDSAVGFQGIRPGRRLRVDQLSEAPIVALALRAANRSNEAERLIREAGSLTRAVYRRGRVPFWFDAQSAVVFAVEGNNGEALSALERAFRRGWRQSNGTDLRNLVEEPAFRALHGDPRFEGLRSQIAGHYARERAEILRLRL